MNELRKLPFLVAYFLLLTIFAYETYSVVPEISDTLDGVRAAVHASSKPPPKDRKTDNLAIPALWLVDGVLLMSLTWMAAGILMPGRAWLPIQGTGSIVIGVVLLIMGLTQWSALLARLYAFFWELFSSRTAEFVPLAMLTVQKVIFVVLIVIANQRFLKVKSLVLLVVTSIGLNIVTALLWKLPFSVAIQDTAAAFINITAGLIWCGYSMFASAISLGRLGIRTALGH